MNPTKEQFDAYQAAFGYFNEKLFNQKLPAVILNFSRRARAYGFFAPERWRTNGDSPVLTHEISLNPTLMERGPKDVYSTLVHELCHLNQHENGSPSKNGYHNREWGKMMKEVGLCPSNTGAEGGKETGHRISHYIVPGGKFEQAFVAIPQEFILPWNGTVEGKLKVQAPKRVKYHCAACDFNVYSTKTDLKLVCGSCQHEIVEAS